MKFETRSHLFIENDQIQHYIIHVLLSKFEFCRVQFEAKRQTLIQYKCSFSYMAYCIRRSTKP